MQEPAKKFNYRNASMVQIENRGFELGLCQMWAYRCLRCNHVWFPKDFDPLTEHDLFDREPPKSCARCKSKYWREIPQRQTKNSGKMLSVVRLRALHRQGKLKIRGCDCPHCSIPHID